MLLEHHEGYILMIIERMTRELRDLLENVNDEYSLKEAKQKAAMEAQEIKTCLNELQIISNKILGISGKDGFLELTETDRLQIRDEITYSFNYIDKSVTTGDISGQQIAIGSNIQQNIQHDDHSGMDSKVVFNLLEQLIQDVKREGLPKQSEEKIIKQLEVSQDELQEEQPDKDYIGRNLQKATDTMKKAGSFIDQSTSIGQKLLKIGKWVGAVISLI
jgi:hypothetical protein